MIRKTIILLIILTANISYANEDDAVYELQQRINELTNKIEQLEHKNDLLAKKVDTLATDVEYRFKEINTKSKKTAETPAVKPGDPKKAKTEFEKAINLLKAQKYSEAERALSIYVKAYPQNEYTGNAYYWLAESFMLRKKYEKAAMNYITSFNKFPKNSKADLSMLKLSSALNELGKKKEACSTLKKLTVKKSSLSQAMQKMLQKEVSKINCKS
jgi:tol-pal system protein YbgF